jgi:hypothetical protein
MSERETLDLELTIRLLKDGSLPRKIPCFYCYRNMYRRLWRRGVVYECLNCDSQTTLDPEEVQKRGFK